VFPVTPVMGWPSTWIAVDLNRERAFPLKRSTVEEIGYQPVPKAGDDLKVTWAAEVALDQRRPEGVGRAGQFGDPVPGKPGSSLARRGRIPQHSLAS
jgi:hypothetical protein